MSHRPKDLFLAKETVLPDYLGMYEIPGQDAITEQSFKRYVRDKEQDQMIQSEAERAKILGQRILDAKDMEKALLIQDALTKEDSELQKIAAREIEHVPTKKIPNLIRLGLASKNVDVQRICANKIYLASKSSLPDLIQTSLAMSDAEVQEAGAAAIDSVTPVSLQNILREKVYAMVQKGLTSEDVDIWTGYAQMIFTTPPENHDELQEKLFTVIKKNLELGDPDTQRKSAEMILYATMERKADLIRLGLSQPDVGVQKICADKIIYAPEDSISSLQEILSKIIVKDLMTPHSAATQVYAEMIANSSPETMNQLFQLAKTQLGNALVEPPLYRAQEISENSFQRVEFPKTGSETTLFGGRLKYKTILRHIKPQNFLVWQKLYEGHALWKSSGFDYVPIEPIQAYHLNKKGLVDVFSGVLDLSFGMWKNMAGEFCDELQADKEKILATLKNQNLAHGHSHNENFCLRFFRDPQGNVDFTKKPRLYLIDFDQALST